MLESIITAFAQTMCETFDFFINAFLAMLTLDLGTFVAYFPMLETGYFMFQSIGIGLILCIAIFQLFKFFTGQITEVQDTPFRIAIRAFLAGLLLWFGGYFIELIVDLAAIPYGAFISADSGEALRFQMLPVDDWDPSILMFSKTGQALVGLSSLTKIVLYLIVFLIICYQIIRLLLEVVERWLMVGLLAFTAPLFYPTLTSQSTSNIFKSWLNMFFSQVILMTISAWMLKVVISGFAINQDDEGVAFRLFLTYALAVIARKIDSYMQNLGLGVAQTGSQLGDSIIGVMGVIGTASRFRPKSEHSQPVGSDNHVGESGNTVVGHEQPNKGKGPAVGVNGQAGVTANGKNAPSDVQTVLDKKNKALGNLPTDDKNITSDEKVTLGADQSEPVAKSNDEQINGSDTGEIGKNQMDTEFDKARADYQNSIAQAQEIAQQEATGGLSGNLPVGTLKATGESAFNNGNEESYGGITTDENDQFVPDEEAQRKGIRFDGTNKRIDSGDSTTTGNYIGQNMADLAKHAETAEMAKNSLDNPLVAEHSLSTMRIDAGAYNSNPELMQNINALGQKAMNQSFEGGLSEITGDPNIIDKNISEFASQPATDGSRNVSFVASDDAGDETKYSLQTNPSEGARKIQSVSGGSWYVTKSPVKNGNFQILENVFEGTGNDRIQTPNNSQGAPIIGSEDGPGK